ncbi:3-deoxy-7-phosphoheptulonate synthase [Streptomyces spinosirectus]|uniref:3-deoxy-7-phosphoheptulonate synthase n=1 Tax=Streptomyces TaxID=1883 RepID=UPI001C9E1C4F|nr:MULTISPECIES: 3-deoxy-7-phosphoheptulonate synthase [Streptomyces]MBY8341417.1 3-deoxy-7-phosphoheptulonate synthase [Streptomyces plumbidurans]UIR20234.1 3-deoxy-7-phosphoheptulonate synthase [Streptomyces spinosirectus]
MHSPPLLAPTRPARWTPSDWRGHPAAQQPDWPDPALLRRVRARLAGTAPLVRPREILDLRPALAQAAHGEAFVVQLGDCAETFDMPTFAGIAARVDLLHSTARTIGRALGRPVIPIGRIAGQYAKPRSSPTERVGGVLLPSFRGHLVNSPEHDAAARVPDAMRLLEGHAHARDVLALLRELAESGMPLPDSTADGAPALWTSHEALLLDYEEPLVRRDPLSGAVCLTSTHLPWIGARTCEPDGAHVRFLSGVSNPVGVKVGPGTNTERLAELCARLDPDQQPGRLVLISRMGADNVAEALPPLVEKVARLGHPVVWLCDPVHGNTYTGATGHKTRHVDTVAAEIRGFFAAVRAARGRPGGIHLEATPADVTECVGGLAGIAEDDVPLRYETACDPRLNGAQTAELASLTAGLCAQG